MIYNVVYVDLLLFLLLFMLTSCHDEKKKIMDSILPKYFKCVVGVERDVWQFLCDV